ncbi:MAG: RNA-binding protein [Dehalococcoidales bacterium]
MNIYVGNLSLETTADELREKFLPFGAVGSVTIMNDKYIGSGQATGYGYVEMVSRVQGIAAVAGLDGKTLRNQPLNVVEALPLSNNKGAKPLSVKTHYRSGRSRQRNTRLTGTASR